MRVLTSTEVDMVGGGILTDAEYQKLIDGAVDMNNEWLAANPVQMPLFSVGGFEVTYTGSFTEGLQTAGLDCLTVGGAVKLVNDFGIVSAVSGLTSSTAAVIGCTAGVGAGILRDW